MELLKKRLSHYIECPTCTKNQKDGNIIDKYRQALNKRGRTGSGHKTKQKLTPHRPSSAPRHQSSKLR